MIKQIISGKVLLTGVSIVMLTVPAFAGWGSVSSGAGSFTGVKVIDNTRVEIVEPGQKGPRLFAERSESLNSQVIRFQGAGFESYEHVTFSAGTESKDGSLVTIISQWDAVADKAGTVETRWEYPSAATTYSVAATGSTSGLTAKIDITPEAGENIDSLTQCANGNGEPQGMDCPENGNTGWVSGNVVASKALYYEGDSIPYRVILTGLDVGDVYEYNIGYDVTKGGLNALDYLTTYNRTITSANPCKKADNQPAFYCNQGTPTSTAAILDDTEVTVTGRPATNGAVNQIPGVYTLWGAQIDEGVAACNAAVGLDCGVVPGYNYSSSGGTWPGDLSASVKLRFKATATTAVIAWGGHISTRSDWGESFGSVNITGSPYHMFNNGGRNVSENNAIFGGNREVQLAQAAVRPTARLTIVKQAAPASVFSFGFSAQDIFAAADTIPFSLVDNDSSTTNQDANNTRVFDGITYLNVQKSITESDPTPFSLASASCVDVDSSPFPSSLNPATRELTLTLVGGDDVTCTFFNDFLTAIEAVVQGRVTVDGRPVLGAWVSAVDSNGNTRYARTNAFGNYSIGELEAGTDIFIEVVHKKYVFPSRFVTLNEDVNRVDFNGTAR